MIREERIYARGASDDKGNMLIPILAAEAWLKTVGSLPINVKFLFEGEEEVGSPHIEEFILEHQQRLTCDYVVSADGASGVRISRTCWSDSRGCAPDRKSTRLNSSHW